MQENIVKATDYIATIMLMSTDKFSGLHSFPCQVHLELLNPALTYGHTWGKCLLEYEKREKIYQGCYFIKKISWTPEY